MILERQILDKVVSVIIKGYIDEDSDFSELLQMKSAHYVFDFGEVSMLNSCGIREWITFIDQLGPDVQLVYKNCPQIIIEQIGMVHGFIRKGARVESFYAPYFCSECDNEKKILLKTDDLESSKAPSLKCDKCGMDLEFDEIEEQYFSFLAK